MSHVQVGEKIKLRSDNHEPQEVTVEEVFERNGCEFARVRFADSHFDTFETKYLKPEARHPATEGEVKNLDQQLDALAQVFAVRKGSTTGTPIRRANQGRKGALAMTMLGLLVMGWLCVALYEGLNFHGWIPHHADTMISAQGSWFVGQSKQCVSHPLAEGTARFAAEGKGVGYALGNLQCDEGPYREMSVTFWGRVRQPEYSAVLWKCTRKQDGFACYELSGLH